MKAVVDDVIQLTSKSAFIIGPNTGTENFILIASKLTIFRFPPWTFKGKGDFERHVSIVV